MKVDIYDIANPTERLKRNYILVKKGNKDLPITLQDCKLVKTIDIRKNSTYIGVKDVEEVIKDIKEHGYARVEVVLKGWEELTKYSRNLLDMYELLRHLKHSTNASFAHIVVNEDDSVLIKVEKFIEPNKNNPAGKMAVFQKNFSSVEMEHIINPDLIIASFIDEATREK